MSATVATARGLFVGPDRWSALALTQRTFPHELTAMGIALAVAAPIHQLVDGHARRRTAIPQSGTAVDAGEAKARVWSAIA